MGTSHKTRLESHANVTGNEHVVPFVQSSSPCMVSSIGNTPFDGYTYETRVVYGFPAMIHAATGLVMKSRSEDDCKSLVWDQFQS